MDSPPKLARKRAAISSRGLFSQAMAGVSHTSNEKSVSHRTSSLDTKIFATQEMIKQIRAIICQGLPDDENNTKTVREHFKQFGVVTKTFCHVEKKQATVHFQTHEHARNAKSNGTIFGKNGIRINIFWRAIKERPKRRNVSEIEEELQAMAGTSDTQRAISADAKKLQKKSSSPEKLKTRTAKKAEFKPDQSLVKKLSMPAKTAGERYEVLNARDRLHRGLKEVKSRTSKVSVGTCPDMCPEKERYARQEKKQLSTFELHSSSQPGDHIVDHALAIKEYSRSSADQEAPLEYELRPSNVLSMTMDYLVCNIVDVLDTQTNISEADWFDFLWNRTRAIRKDITQQHLCNLQVVALLEKCARFHIYCSHRLCEQDMMNFDPKINNENLTKCMQTLKHFYYDLGIKDVQCPCESEFRSYDILLNLSRGEILREVQQFTADVRKSAYVKFALDVSSAFNSNNFTRFFKLTKQASFLHACILHRYFTEIRTKALQTMVKSYSPANHSVQFPVADLMNSLGFEDENEAIRFCIAHGLMCDQNDVRLNRNSFFYPESAVLIGRAKLIIESKIHTSVGEIVNGGPLPQNPRLYYRPEDSFDSNNILITGALELPAGSGDAVISAAQPQPAQPETINASAEAQLAEAKVAAEKREQELRAKQQKLRAVLNGCMIQVLKDMVDDVILDVCLQTVSFSKFLKEQSLVVYEQLVNDIIRERCVDVADEAILKRQQQLEAEEKAKAELKMRQNRVANLILEELINSVTGNLILNVSSDQMELVEQQLKEQSQQRAISSLADDIIIETLNDTIHKIGTNFHYEKVVCVLQKLDLFIKKMQIKKQRKYFKVWLRHHRINTRYKNATKTFPSAASSLSLQDRSRLLGPELPTSSIADLQSLDCRSKYLLDVGCLAQLIETEYELLPLNISAILQDVVPDKCQDIFQGDTCFWKMALSLSPDSALSDWLRTKFSRGNQTVHPIFSQVKTLSCYTADVSSSNALQYNKMAVCITSVAGPAVEDFEPAFVLHGTLGILIAAEFHSEDYSKVVQDCRSRLESMLDCRPAYPTIPVALIVSGHHVPNLEIISDLLDIESRNDMISHFNVFELKTELHDSQAVPTLIEAVQWLANNYPSVPTVSCMSIAEFFESRVLSNAIRTICEDQQQRLKSGFLHQDASHTIDMINKSISHMKSAENCGTGIGVSWPPPEFCDKHPSLPPKNWSTYEYFHSVSDTFAIAALHQIDFAENWQEACTAAWQFVHNHKHTHLDNTQCITRIDYLLSRTCRIFKQKCQSDYGISDCQPSADNAPWTDIIMTIVDYLMSVIYYISNKSPNIYFVEDWLILPKITSCSLQLSSVQSHNASVKADKSIIESVKKRKLEQSYESEVTSKTKFKFFKSSLETKAEGLSQQFLKALQNEQKISERFESTLLAAQDESYVAIDTQDFVEDDFSICSIEQKMKRLRDMLNDSRNKSLSFDSHLSMSLEL